MHDFETFLAPAKINLFLHIIGQRTDGYHLLQTAFRMLDYYDTIQIKTTKSSAIKRVNDVAGVPETQDLSIRAAQLLQKYTGCCLGAEILVDKKIPMGGGLGGGSSDAATVLLALNQRWQLNLTNPELLTLGLKLGADVPFFIYGKNAWAEGVGEQLQALTLQDAYYVVITPNANVSTAKIFANNQLTKNSIPKKIAAFSEIVKLNGVNAKNGNIKEAFINELEKAVCSIYPEVKASLDWLKQYGDARMSGSGASVFLEVPNQEIANKIYQQKPSEYFGFVAKGLNQHPLLLR